MELLLIFGAVFALLVLLALLSSAGWPGSGADLVDWDPSKRIEARMSAEAQDEVEMLEMHNRRRRSQGLADRTMAEYQEALVRGEI